MTQALTNNLQSASVMFFNLLYAPWTFLAFVFVGVAQAVIGWESGELAVRALGKESLTDEERRRVLRLVRALAILLFPATIFVGIVNDRNQKDADDKAKVAQASQLDLQEKLNVSDGRAIRFQNSFDQFTKTLDPAKFSATQFLKFQQASRDAESLATRALNVNANKEIRGPFASLTDADLKEKTIWFSHHLHSVGWQISEAEDKYYSYKRNKSTLVTNNQPLPAGFEEALESSKQVFDAIVANTIRVDAPLTLIYRDELLRRLGPTAQNVEFPVADEKDIGQFLTFGFSWLGTWAAQLPSDRGAITPQ